MQTLWVPRISVWIRGKNNKGACSVLVVRKHLLEANTYTTQIKTQGDVLGEHWQPQTIANNQMCIPAVHVAISGGYLEILSFYGCWRTTDKKAFCLEVILIENRAVSNLLSQPYPNLEIIFHIFFLPTSPPTAPRHFWLMQAAV